MPFVAGGAAPSPPTDPPKSPRTPSSLQKRKIKNLFNFRTLFSGPRLAIFLFFFVSSLARFFEVIVFLLLEPLGVNFELPS